VVQNIPADDPDFRLHLEETAAEGFVQEEKDGMNGLGFRIRAVERDQLIPLARGLKAEYPVAGLGNKVASAPESINMRTPAISSPVSGWRRTTLATGAEGA
jgi:hypothetical protein